LGVVGESGCGKSVTALSILRLAADPPGRIVGGSIQFEGTNLLGLTEAEMEVIRGKDISMIFQEPMMSLNPLLTVGPVQRGDCIAPGAFTARRHGQGNRDAFDLAYSSLALHYVEELDRLISVVYRSLAEGGNFVFSVEHPIFTAPSEPQWSMNSAGRKIWPVDSYLEEGPRRTDWLAIGLG